MLNIIIERLTGVTRNSLLTLGVLLLSATLASAAFAQTSTEEHPGFVDFSRLSGLGDAEPTVQISLKAPLLTMVTNLLKQEDEQAADFISKLMRVNVNVYQSERLDTQAISASMAVLAGELDAQGWERVVRVREEEDHVDIYFRLSDSAEMIFGIAIMVASREETVLVNIVGDISVQDLSALAKRFDIDELSDIDIEVDTDL